MREKSLGLEENKIRGRRDRRREWWKEERLPAER